MREYRLFTKYDFFLLLFLIVIGTALTLGIYLPKDTPGKTVLEIRQNGTVVKTLSLTLSDYSETITFPDGGENTFTIDNGTVWMRDANCNDHTCTNTGIIRRAGESIVCLPHRLVLQIVTEDSATPQEPDAVVH